MGAKIRQPAQKVGLALQLLESGDFGVMDS
jgi:hypothetical protein